MNPKHLLPLLLLALTACQPPQTVENTNLCNYLPPHSEKTRLDDEDAHRFDAAADRISAATAHGNDSKRKHCGQTWRSVASDDDLKTAVASTLGQDWNYRDTLQQDGLTIALWETRSTYIKNSDSDLNGAVVFGIIISPFAIVLAIALPLFWRKRRRRKSS